MCLYGHANIDRCCCCDFKHLFRKRKGPIWDPQADLGLAQGRTYKMRKQKGRQIPGPKGHIRDTQIDLG